MKLQLILTFVLFCFWYGFLPSIVALISAKFNKIKFTREYHVEIYEWMLKMPIIVHLVTVLIIGICSFMLVHSLFRFF